MKSRYYDDPKSRNVRKTENHDLEMTGVGKSQLKVVINGQPLFSL